MKKLMIAAAAALAAVVSPLAAPAKAAPGSRIVESKLPTADANPKPNGSPFIDVEEMLKVDQTPPSLAPSAEATPWRPYRHEEQQSPQPSNPSPSGDPLPVVDTPLAGWQDLKFGDPRAQTMARLKRKFVYKGSGDNGVEYFEGRFAGYDACMVIAGFYRGQLSDIQIGVFSQRSSSTVDVYFDLLRSLTQKYGEPRYLAVLRRGAEPEIVGNWIDARPSDDDQRLRDVLNSRANLSARWKFVSNGAIYLRTFPRGRSSFDGIATALSYGREDLLTKRLNQDLSQF